ncbi:ABC transporter permease subunit [Streptomyces sp. NPDC002308]
MSTLAPPRPAATRATANAGLRGPARTVVRQHRRTFQLLILLTLLAVAGVVAVVLWVDHDAGVFAGTGCEVNDTTPLLACAQSVRDYMDSQFLLHHLQGDASTLLIVLPAVYGAFMAGPAIGRELESGTYRLAWTQSVAPARWLTAKLAVPTALAVACTLVLTATSTWLSTRPEEYAPLWYQRELYAATGTVPVAYALFGLAVGTLAGLLLRRTLTSMALAVVVQGIAVWGMDTVRDRLWPVMTENLALNGISGFLSKGQPSLVDWGYRTASGARFPSDICLTAGPTGTQDDHLTCLDRLGVIGSYADYHPESHRWPLQLVESGILLAAAALAVFTAYRLLRRLHA